MTVPHNCSHAKEQRLFWQKRDRGKKSVKPKSRDGRVASGQRPERAGLRCRDVKSDGCRGAEYGGYCK